MMLRNEEGQAIAEAAIVLPAMLFLLLVAVQLSQLQQARILAESAVFAAARTGIVMNGDPGKMHDAATFAILPGVGRTDSFPAIAKTLLRFKAENAVLAPFGLTQLRVQVHNPVAADFRTWGKHLNGQEIDFDDVRPGATEATLLSLQLRYLYELRVPFANRLIQTLWMAAQAGLLEAWQGWDLASPRFGGQSGPDAVGISRGVAASTVASDGMAEGIKVAALVAAGRAGRYYLPVEAFYTMRMQSNPYRKWARP
jgi:TadE-like protein